MICISCMMKQNRLYKDLYKCPNCQLISSKKMSKDKIYNRKYLKKYADYSLTELGHDLNHLRIELVKKYISEGTVLDYGCATGFFHRSLNGGLKGIGYDVNPFSQYSKMPEEDFEAITLWDVIEHLNDPQHIFYHIEPTYVFVATPSYDDFTDKLTKWRHYRPHEHVHLFNEKSLVQFFLTQGYEPLEINYDESKLRKGGGDKNILTYVGRRICG